MNSDCNAGARFGHRQRSRVQGGLTEGRIEGMIFLAGCICSVQAPKSVPRYTAEVGAHRFDTHRLF
jgi:hypothetical protein